MPSNTVASEKFLPAPLLFSMPNCATVPSASPRVHVTFRLA